MNNPQPLLGLIEQVTQRLDLLDELLTDEVDRRLHHPEKLTLFVAQCLEAQSAVDELLPRLRTTRRTLRRLSQSLKSESGVATASA